MRLACPSTRRNNILGSNRDAVIKVQTVHALHPDLRRVLFQNAEVRFMADTRIVCRHVVGVVAGAVYAESMSRR